MKSGTTTVCEFVEGPNALPGILNATAKAIEETGIRAQVGYEVTERIPGAHILEKVSVEYAERGFEENIRFFEKYPSGNGGRITGRLGLHTAFTNSRETMKKAREIADRYHVGIQTHIAEIPRVFVVEKHGMSAPQILEETGVLGPDVVAAHCIDLTDEDVAILARNRVNVAHTPMTNSFGGNGVARVPYMVEQGMNITLGHDCFFTLDISEYLRYAFLLHKAHNANAALFPIFQVLDWALGNAARALGMEGEIGSLKVGKKSRYSDPQPGQPVANRAVLRTELFRHDLPGQACGDRARGRRNRCGKRPLDQGGRGRSNESLPGRGKDSLAQDGRRDLSLNPSPNDANNPMKKTAGGME